MSRATAVVLLAGATYLAAWAFGAELLYPVAVGLALTAVIGSGWVRLSTTPLRFARVIRKRGTIEEGEDVPVQLELELRTRLKPGSIVVVERISKLGERVTPVRSEHGRLQARYTLRALPRGRYTFDDARAVLEDPFGIERRESVLGGKASLLVYPRLVELPSLFSENGGAADDGRRLLLRRPSGFDLHSVREYQEGESLRGVHWRTTAKRGRLMVKELEDAPRNDVAVLLDAHAGPSPSEARAAAFDVQVRAAGSLLGAHARRGRRCVLVVSAAVPQVQRVHAYDGDWQRALELLAAAEPTGATPAPALIADEASTAGGAPELTVVTAALSPELADRVVQQTLARRRVALVYVDATSFGNGGRAARPQPSLLRLQAAGVAVAVLRRGDDLEQKLTATRSSRAAHG